MPDIYLTMSSKNQPDQQGQILDEQGNPVQDTRTILDEHGNPAAPTEDSSQPGIFSRTLNWATTPLYNLGEKINELEHVSSADPKLNKQFQTEESSRLLQDAKLNEFIPGLGTANSMMRGFFRGSEEGTAPATSQLTSPAGAVATIAGFGEAPLARAALSRAGAGEIQAARQLWQTARMANLARRAASVPYAVHGAEKVYSEPTWGGKLAAAGETAGGLLGMQGKLIPPGSIQVRSPEVTVEPPRAPGNLLGDIPAPGAGPKAENVPPPPFTEGEFKEATPKYTSPRSDEVPNYYNTSGEHTPSFANDVDRAMWMVSELRPSRKYTEYLEFVKNVTGLPTERARQMSVDFGKYVKQHLQKAGPGITPVPETYGSEEWNAPPSNERSKTAEQDAAEREWKRTHPEGPQMMRVPGINPDTGMENIAMGGASPRVLEILGGNMYSHNRPVIVTKELLQNAEDEHKIAGITAPIEVQITKNDINPQTNTPAHSVTVQDHGRGLTPEQLYTKFTDLGETGKDTEEAAGGGFGFAKAAPMQAGKYFEATTVVDTPKGRMKYTFKGNPVELRNQALGVPLKPTPTTESTGTKVTTYFPLEMNTDHAGYFARSFGRDSHGVSTIELTENDGPTTIQKTRNSPNPIPPLKGTIETPGATINLHYHTPQGNAEIPTYFLDILNKGLYQHVQVYPYGASLPKVPSTIQANIIAKVKETDPDYPFTTNREQIKNEIAKAVTKWVHENIAKDLLNKRQAGTQRAYDTMNPFMAIGPGKIVHMYDPGERFNQVELNDFARNPHLMKVMNALDVIKDVMLGHADKLGWKMDVPGLLPSQKLQKFGILAHQPAKESDKKPILGIHIPNPSEEKESAILIGLFEQIKEAIQKPESLDQLTTELITTMAHEIAHIPGGGHDVNHSYRDAALRGSLGAKTTIKMLNVLTSVFGDKNGQIKPELLRLFDIYEKSRLRSPSTNDTLLDTGIEHARPTNTQGGERPSEKRRGQGTSYDTYRRAIAARELYELPRGLTASWDLSAPLRQGKWLVGTKEWRSAFGKMIKAAMSEGNYDAVMQYIEGIPVVRNGVAYRGGLHLTDLSNQPSRREEFLRSVWAETGEFLPKELQAAYKATIGRGVRASNRAYTAFLNALRAEYLQKMYDWMPRDKRNDWTYIGQMCQFVNDATGRGKYELGIGDYHIPIGRGGLSLPTKIDLEHLSPGFNTVLYAGRNMMSNARMLNPGTYIHLPPQIRNEYLMSLLRYAGYTAMVLALYKMKGAKISTDPRSSDFLKARFGNIRMDPGGGNQQIMVLASRLASGYYKSSTSGKQYELGKGFKATTRKDVYEDFMANKLHPWWRFAYDLGDASGFKPFAVGDRTLQQFIPMVVGDLAAIYKEDPSLMALLLPATLGQGAQTYEKGTDNPVFTPVIADALGKNPEDIDYKFKGGPIPKVGKYMNQVLDKMSRYGDQR